MRWKSDPDRYGWPLWRRVWGSAALAAVLLPGMAVARQQGQAGTAAQTRAQDGANPAAPVAAQAAGGQTVDSANGQRKRQIADEGAQLLKLATDLKAEVDKTTKDTLSLAVIRKADEIERLAHNVKEKMKLTVGGS